MPPGITTLAADAPELSAANTGFMLICSALVMLMTPVWPSSTEAWSASRAPSTC